MSVPIMPVVLGVGAVAVGSLLAAGGAGAELASPTIMASGIVAAGSGARLGVLPGGRLRIEATAGTPLLAPIAGTVSVSADGGVTLIGAGEDAGVAVTYHGVDTSLQGPVQSGEALGRVAAAGEAELSLLVDGAPADASLLVGDGGAASPRPPGADAIDHLVRPVEGAVITQGFGCTAFAAEPPDRSCATGHVHSGIDLAAPLGTPVRAAGGGMIHVVRAVTGYGLHVFIDAGAGRLVTLYAHLSRVAVADGDSVVAGEVIGELGSTGNSTGPHLHFEVRRAGVPTDPRLAVALA